jgi:uncharacterized protein YidB (DUF937 family)
MGLLDVLNGMQNGPRGQSGPGGSGGMSPITMAILGLLAYKAIKGISSNQPGAKPAGTGTNAGGGLGDLLPGGLGGLLAGGAAGSVLSGGLNDLLKQFQQSDQGDVANSWVGTGPNKTISPNDLAKVLDNEQIKTLMAQTGISRDALIAGLSKQLPQIVDELTPNGRLPTAQELSR